MAAVLAGSLSRFSAVYVVRFLQIARATGRLQLFRGEEQAELWMEDGQCLHTRTSGRNLRIGDVLVRHGHIHPGAMELALAIQKDLPGQRIGSMLVNDGAISREDLSEALLTLQRHVMAGVLLWRDGEFRFMADECLPEGAVDDMLCADGRTEEMLRTLLSLAEQEKRFSARSQPGQEKKRAA